MKNNFQIKKLGDIVLENKKSTLKSKGNNSGSYPFYVSGYKVKSIDRYLIDNENIFLPTGGKFFVHFFNGKAAYSTDTWSIKTINNVDIKYLYYFLVLNQDLVGDTLFKGATIKHLQKKDFRNLEIAIPSLIEQQRIVKILDDVFGNIAKTKENTEKNLQNVKELFDLYFQNVFTAKDTHWKESMLGEVCSLYQGIAINSKTRHALVEKSNLPLLRIKDLKHNTVEQYIDPENYPINALVNESDIIYTRTGSLGLVFRGRIGVLHNNSFKVVPKPELSRDFLYVWLQNPIFKSKIMRLALNAAQPDITHAIFKIQKIKIPPLSEQKIIVAKIDIFAAKCKGLELIYKQKIAALDDLKKTILQEAFSGEL